MYIKIFEVLFGMSEFSLLLGAGAASRAQSEKHGKSMFNNLLARALGMLLGAAESVQEGCPSCLLLGKNDISAPASLYPPLAALAEACCQDPSSNCE